ncbi:tRNA pseudouridine synthase B [Angustibacter aerolatus]|uniref:tRNA pseudouridine(55) synthase n=1 Tax=Angustibacter aerolatus TaxID=1162965 RepID=A0ABQ6JBH6_9ACTN|nr:tRNA pseudouridine synthase B [Angustibacter aerolatus]
MATGVLVVGVNRATRLLTHLVGADKTYRATVRLGQATVTDDAEGEVTQTADPAAVAALTAADVEQALATLRGPIEQVPSAVSAIKVDGQRAYARVRSGEQVALAARPVTVHRLDLLGSRPGDGLLDLDVECDVARAPTSARSPATSAPHSGSVATSPRCAAPASARTTSTAAAPSSRLGESFTVLPLAEAARAAFAVRELTADEARTLRFGQRLSPSGLPAPVAAFDPDGTLVALLEDRGDTARSLLVVPTD